VPERPELAEVFARHFDYVWRTLLRLGVAEADAEDLAQEVFLIVHRRLASYDPARPIEAWLYGIARNVARDDRKRARRRREVAAETERGRPDAGYARFEAAQLVRRALSALPPERRDVFVLHELDRIPMEEVAHALGINVNTAYARARTAREEFRRAVRRERGAT